MKRTAKLILFSIVCIIGVAFFFSFAIEVTARHSIKLDNALEEYDEAINTIANNSQH